MKQQVEELKAWLRAGDRFGTWGMESFGIVSALNLRDVGTEEGAADVLQNAKDEALADLCMTAEVCFEPRQWFNWIDMLCRGRRILPQNVLVLMTPEQSSNWPNHTDE